jgi:uncharacterized membrane protein
MYFNKKSLTPHFVPLYIQNLGCVHLHYNQYNIFDNPTTSFYFFYDKANPSNWYIRLSTNNTDEAFFYYPTPQADDFSIPANRFLDQLWIDLNVRPDHLTSKTLMRYMLDKCLVQGYFGELKANLSVLCEFEQSTQRIAQEDNNIIKKRIIFDFFEHLAKEASCEKSKQQQEKLLQMLFIIYIGLQDEENFEKILQKEGLVVNGEYQLENICNQLAINVGSYFDRADNILTEDLIKLIHQRDQTFRAAAFWYSAIIKDLQFKETMVNALSYIEVIGVIFAYFWIQFSLLVFGIVALSFFNVYSSHCLDWLFEGDKQTDAKEAKAIYRESEPHTNDQGMSIINDVCKLFESKVVIPYK